MSMSDYIKSIQTTNHKWRSHVVLSNTPFNLYLSSVVQAVNILMHDVSDGYNPPPPPIAAALGSDHRRAYNNQGGGCSTGESKASTRSIFMADHRKPSSHA